MNDGRMGFCEKKGSSNHLTSPPCMHLLLKEDAGERRVGWGRSKSSSWTYLREQRTLSGKRTRRSNLIWGSTQKQHVSFWGWKERVPTNSWNNSIQSERKLYHSDKTGFSIDWGAKGFANTFTSSREVDSGWTHPHREHAQGWAFRGRVGSLFERKDIEGPKPRGCHYPLEGVQEKGLVGRD